MFTVAVVAETKNCQKRESSKAESENSMGVASLPLWESRIGRKL